MKRANHEAALMLRLRALAARRALRKTERVHAGWRRAAIELAREAAR